MKLTGVTPILNVSDVPASVAWFELMGFDRHFSHNLGGMIKGAAMANEHGPATFAGIGCGEEQIFLCQNAQGVRGGKSARFDGSDDFGATWMSLWLATPAEVDAAHAAAVEHGVVVVLPPTDEPWGVRECRIMHPDGHVFRLSAHLSAR